VGCGHYRDLAESLIFGNQKLISCVAAQTSLVSLSSRASFLGLCQSAIVPSDSHVSVSNVNLARAPGEL
jgi:hypothetical protein